MKKIISCLAACAAILAAVHASAAECTFEYESGNTTYIIKGTAKKREPVTLRVLYLGEESDKFGIDPDNLPETADEYKDFLWDIDYIKADKIGNFEFDCKMDKQSGYYYFTVADSDGNQSNKLVEWLSPTYKQEKIDMLNGYIAEKDEASAAAFLKRYAKAFELENEYFDKEISAEDSKIPKMLVESGSVSDEKDLKIRVDLCCIYAAFERGAQDIENVIDFFAEELGINECKAYSVSFKEKFSDSMKQKILAELAKMPRNMSGEGFNSALGDIIVLKGIEYSDDWGIAQGILSDNIEKLSENTVKRYAALEKNYPSYFANVAKALKGTASADMTELDKKVLQAVADAESAASSASSGGSGSGSSGGGYSSGSKGSKVTVPAGTTTVKEPTEEKAKFNDLENVKWAEVAINALAGKGIISGRSETNFAPNDFITREEFLSILMRAFGMIDETAQCDMQDVEEGAWYYSAVASAYTKGITKGINENEFGIGRNITREDLCVLAYNTAEKFLDVSDENPGFSDSEQIAGYAKKAVSAMAKAEIVSGMDNGGFEPKSFATRAQTAMIIYKLMLKGGNI